MAMALQPTRHSFQPQQTASSKGTLFQIIALKRATFSSRAPIGEVSDHIAGPSLNSALITLHRYISQGCSSTNCISESVFRETDIRFYVQGLRKGMWLGDKEYEDRIMPCTDGLHL
jgi:hypothetical protein